MHDELITITIANGKERVSTRFGLMEAEMSKMGLKEYMFECYRLVKMRYDQKIMEDFDKKYENRF